MELRPGNARAHRPREQQGGPETHKGDTTHLDAMDSRGDMLSATPSGAATARMEPGYAIGW